MTVRLRYKLPRADTSQETSVIVSDGTTPISRASADQRFAAAVAGFGMLLRGSEYEGTSSFQLVEELARSGAGRDPRRQEFLSLVKSAARLARQR